MFATRQYADLSEYGYGVAILSESKYGFSCRGNVLRISLLRAATAPDAEQDQGKTKLGVRRTAVLTATSRQARVLVGGPAPPWLLPGIRRPDRRDPVQLSSPRWVPFITPRQPHTR